MKGDVQADRPRYVTTLQALFYSYLGFCEMGMFLKGGMFVIVDRRIVRWFAKSLSENEILCVHVIGYKLGYKIIYKLE